jgi:hypothetical protein
MISKLRFLDDETGIVYSVLQKSVAIYWLLENAIDSRRRIKTTTYSDLQQKPCQFYWHGLLQITICKHPLLPYLALPLLLVAALRNPASQ